MTRSLSCCLLRELNSAWVTVYVGDSITFRRPSSHCVLGGSKTTRRRHLSESRTLETRLFDPANTTRLMSSTAEASIPSTPRVVLGPAHSVLLICTFVTLILYGVALYQAHEFYYVQSEGPNQHIFNYYVAGLVILDAVHTILAIHTNYRNLVTNYLFPDRLNDPIWSLNLQPLVTGLVIVACQVFFARRVYLVDKMYRPLVKYTGGMFVVELACAVAFTIIAFRTSTVHQLNDYSWLQSGGYGVVISADAIMTTVLVVALHRGRSEFYKSGTNSLLDILTRYAIYTGLLTAILATICFISALILPNNLLFGAFDLICVKVYINSVLAASVRSLLHVVR
ncbi:hypothetical protein C8Q77DRAFT_618313 [Trametes polyzona]|nr:hypothetical protein C8Q77DRAFT_618313 [Trametes polyzona]